MQPWTSIDPAKPRTSAARVQAKRPSSLGLCTALTVLLSIQISQVYRLVTIFGISGSIVNIGLSVAILITLLLIGRRFLQLLRRKDVVVTLFTLGVLPLVSAAVGGAGFYPDLIFRWAAFLLLFLAGVMLVEISRPEKVDRIVLFLIFSQICGAIISLLAPSLFAPMASQTGASLDYEGRAFGFFLQPNALAIAAVAFYVIYANYERAGVKREEWVVFGVTLLCVGMSASRFSLIIVLVMFFARWILLLDPRFSVEKSLIRVGVLVFAAAATIIPLSQVAASLLKSGAIEAGSGLDRVLRLAEFQLGHSGDYEAVNSIAYRVKAQEIYWDLISHRPIFGHGFGAERALFSSNAIEVAAHSTALSLAIQMGLLYLVILAACVSFPLFVWKGAAAVSRRHYVVFLAFSFAALAFNHGLFENGVFSFAFGVMASRLRHSGASIFRYPVSVATETTWRRSHSAANRTS